MADEALWDDVHPVPPRPKIQASPGMWLADRYELDLLVANWPQTDESGRPRPSGHLITSWQATDKTLSRGVLMHLMAPDDPRTPQTLNAARQAAVSNDARFLRVLDAMDSSAQDPYCFVVSELPPGKSLRALLNQVDGNAGLGNLEAAYVVQQVCEALAPMHEQGKFHLCLRPDAIMVSDVGDVKILGFLVEAAVRDLPEREGSLEEQRSIDMTRAGALLYACLTGYWPVPLEQPQRVTYGLAPAPLQGLPGAQRRIEPHVLNAQVHPTLSAIAMQLLHAESDGQPPAKAEDVASTLQRLIGKGEPQDALAARVSGRPLPAASSELLDDDQATALLPSVNDPEDFEATQAIASADLEHRTAVQIPEDDAPTIASQAVPAEQPAPSKQRSKAEPVKASPSQAQLDRRQLLRRRRTLLGLGAFVVIALLILQLNSCLANRTDDPEKRQRKPPATPPATQQLQIAAATDFDPVADGGEQNENKQSIPLMHDGDPNTAWRTLTYFNNPNFGRLKPGAGVLIDLGSAKELEYVELLLENEPNEVQLMIPATDPTAAQAPIESVQQWQIVSRDEAAGKQTRLALDQPTATRWVLIYFTKLPPIENGRFRTGIYEATVFGR